MNADTSAVAEQAVVEGNEPEVELTPYPKIVERPDVPGVIFKLQGFEGEGKFSGFWFYIKEYKDLDSIRNQLSPLVKPGENVDDYILAVFNSRLAAMMRTKVTTTGENALLPGDEDKRQAMLDKGDNLVIDVESAIKYVPGKTEPYSISGINKRLKELFSLKAEEEKLGDKKDEAKINAIKAEGKALLEKRKELMIKEEAAFE